MSNNNQINYNINQIISLANNNYGNIPSPAIERALLNQNQNLGSPLISSELNKLFNLATSLTPNIDFKKLQKETHSLQENSNNIKYIFILKKSKWPLFLINNRDIKKEILQLDESLPNYNEALSQIAYKYCDTDFFVKLHNKWNECRTIKSDRKQVLSEALELHNRGYFFGSTSILMCQLYGVVSDITDVIKKEKIELHDKHKIFIADYLNVKLEDIDSEKGRLLQTTFMTTSKHLMWRVAAEYLQKEILCSSESKKRWASQPLRNKICHGDQLNFGTREHSLKSVLIIDLLIQLANEIEYVSARHET